MRIFVPGRTEIIGNHTDHQMGRVIASAVKPGMYAQCGRLRRPLARVKSGARRPMYIQLHELEPRKEEEGTTAGLIRGVAAALKKRGWRVGGFYADVESQLRSGGGLSSSAAFCILIGRIINSLYNDGHIKARTLAECAQEAENIHFGKPSGLMDQMACAEGRAVYMDFLTGEVRTISGDFSDMGLTLCLTDTGGSHAGLTEDYAAIPADMRSVAQKLGHEYLGECSMDEFFASELPRDRAWSRAKHFFEENERVPRMLEAMENNNADECIRLMNESGRSSENNLKNICCPAGDDRLLRGLEISAQSLEGRGAWRVHGGGFAGCVQALMPESLFDDYRREMDKVFGEGSCFKIL